jgi:hypothetical protein
MCIECAGFAAFVKPLENRDIDWPYEVYASVRPWKATWEMVSAVSL